MRRVRQERGEPRPLGFQLGALHARGFDQSGGRPGLVSASARPARHWRDGSGPGQFGSELGDAPSKNTTFSSAARSSSRLRQRE